MSQRLIILLVLGTVCSLACGQSPQPAATTASPPPEAPPPLVTTVSYQIVAQGGAGLPVEVDGKPAGVLDQQGQLTLPLEPREQCYAIHVRLGDRKTVGDCHVVEAASAPAAGASPTAAPQRQIVLDLLAQPQ